MDTSTVLQCIPETGNSVSDTQSTGYPVADMVADLGPCPTPTTAELDAAYGEFGHTYYEEIMSKTKKRTRTRTPSAPRPQVVTEAQPDVTTVADLVGLPVNNPGSLKQTHERRFLPQTAAYTVATWVTNTFIEELNGIADTPDGVHVLQALAGWAKDKAAEAGSKLGGESAFPGTDAQQAKLFAGLSLCLEAFTTPE